MSSDANKPGDSSHERQGDKSPEKASEKLFKASPEADAKTYRAVLAANPNRTDTVSPDGKSKFALTDNGKTLSSKADQEKVLTELKTISERGDMLGAGGKAIEAPLHQNQPDALVQQPGTETSARDAAANLFRLGTLYADGMPRRPDDLIAQIGPDRTAVHEAVMTGLGHLHGATNFAVNTIVSVGDTVRMLDAAQRKFDPNRSLEPDTDPEATRKLHDTCQSLAMGSRVLLQFSTTLNKDSPFFGKDFDPEGRLVAERLAQTMPEKLKDEISKFKNLDTEAKAAKSTELFLDIYTFAETGGMALTKAGHLAKDSKMLSQISSDMQTFATKLKELPRSEKMLQMNQYLDASLPNFGPKLAANGPSLGPSNRAHDDGILRMGKHPDEKPCGKSERSKESRETKPELQEKVDGPKPISLEKLAEHPIVREVLERTARTGRLDPKDGHRVTDIIRESVRETCPHIDEKNIAVALVKNQGKQEILWAINGTSREVPGLPVPEQPRLHPYHSGALLRDRDSEFKILNEIAKRFEEQSGKVNAEIMLYSEQKPCVRSCEKVIEDFKKLFKNRGDSIKFPEVTWSYKNLNAKDQGLMDRYK